MNSEIEEIVTRRLSEFARKLGKALNEEWEKYPSNGLDLSGSPVTESSTERDKS